jgi:hypothetical protein
MLTKKEDVIKVCGEETISERQDSYMEFNKKSRSYTWKFTKEDEIIELELSKTLEENGIPDESEKFLKFGLNDDFDIPVLHIYYNDDLNYA